MTGKEAIFEVLFFLLVAVAALSINLLTSELAISIKNSAPQQEALVSNAPVSQAPAAESISDADIFFSCYQRAAGNIEHPCLKADFNRDGVINEDDLKRYQNALLFDLNDDSLIDINYQINAPYVTDYSILVFCTEGKRDDCSAADVNGDGLINLDDVNLFFDILPLDLNGDGFIEKISQ